MRDWVASRFAQRRCNVAAEVDFGNNHRTRNHIIACATFIAESHPLLNTGGRYLNAIGFAIGNEVELTLRSALTIGRRVSYAERSAARSDAECHGNPFKRAVVFVPDLNNNDHHIA